MKFFDIKDFEYDSHDFGEMGKFIRLEYAANRTNEKLEKLAKPAFGFYQDGFFWAHHDKLLSKDTHKVLLISIEPLEKCKHPAEKVESYYKKPCDSTSKYFKCECGVIVTAQKFYEVEE